MENEISDLIYEAGVTTETWDTALDMICHSVGAASGEIFVFDGPGAAPRYRSTVYTNDALARWVAGGAWRDAVMGKMVAKTLCPGFLNTADILTLEQWNSDPTAAFFQKLDLHHQLFSPVPLATGEMVFFSFERFTGDGRFPLEAKAFLERLLPHLSRAALVAARLGLERARGAVEALERLRIPAAVIDGQGRIRSVNDLFAARPDLFQEGAFGRLAISDAPADALFNDALAAPAADARTVRSIPLRGHDERLPFVVHLLPLRRSARDIFTGSDLLVVASEIGARGVAPASALLRALFDLSPPEARLAAALAEGDTVGTAARRLGITQKTARTYLERVFAKTGRRRQAELIDLLRDIRSPPAHDRARCGP